jgi:hypothetical protein
MFSRRSVVAALAVLATLCLTGMLPPPEASAAPGPTPPAFGYLNGYVLSNGSPVAGATVNVSQNGAVIRTGTTNSSGFCSFRLPVGTYTIEVAGYPNSAQTATVKRELIMLVFLQI